MAKIFNRSTGMLNSIRSAILNNCQGVTTVIVYENDTDETDADGRYPHSIEVVCDGGADAEIAQQILNTKPCGINTYGETEITLYGTYNEEIVIRFNRPNYVNLWFNVELTVAKNATLPSNYDTLIRTAIISAMGSIGCGDDIIPQEVFLPTIYSNVYGIGYVEITMETGDSKPSEYEQHVVYATVRDRFITSEDMIEVSFSG